MAYIGQSIKNGTFTTLDTSGNTYNGSNTAFALGTQVGSPAQLLVSHDGVIQKPGTDYTLSSGGTAITFTTAPASGASIFIVEISGAVGGPLGSDLNGSELILDADGDTSIHASTDDQIDIKISGADDFKFTANSMNVLSGSTLTVDSGATITNSGTATGFGKINQVVQTYIDSVGFETSSSTPVQLTGVTANITPSATSSKILVIGTISAGAAVDYKMFFQLRKGTTLIGNSASAGSREISIGMSLNVQVNMPMTHNFQYLHSPSSTDQQTYNVYGHAESNGTLRLNRGSTDSDAGTVGRGTTALTLIEILA